MNIKSSVFPLGTILSKPATGLFFFLFFYNPFSFLLPTGGTQSNKCSAGFPSLSSRPVPLCKTIQRMAANVAPDSLPAARRPLTVSLTSITFRKRDPSAK